MLKNDEVAELLDSVAKELALLGELLAEIKGGCGSEKWSLEEKAGSEQLRRQMNIEPELGVLKNGQRLREKELLSYNDLRLLFGTDL